MTATTEYGLTETVAPSSVPTGKVRAATLGAALGGALGTIAASIAATHPRFVNASVGLQAAMPILVTSLASALSAGLCGWLKRPDPEIRLLFDDDNRPRIARRRRRRAAYR